MGKETDSELNAFIEEWKETSEKNRKVFLHFREYLGKKEGVTLEFIPRPGLTYSLRAVTAAQEKRGLFVMVDVIEDTPRWLSVCFYGEMITDPEERGDFVPEGLLGEDAVCFDIEEWDEELIRYVEIRLDEACRFASEK
ncbi:hypothetical protein [uncultured Desulfosarcina sp.]|uniref:hypothetical protein n=1 Tax=uncultured Desulfosarcina sp. TaxID=218289 RepID=UPI0029C8A694|nr:hypothetical protein [uncultured Desulfosarcina sp.]